MSRIPADHPSQNRSLLSGSPEAAVAAFVACGDLSVDDLGRVWRHRRKVGGHHNPRMMDIPAVRAENVLSSGRHQVQVYILGTRVVCLAARLVWFLVRGEIPQKSYIHHNNHDLQDNGFDNLSCMSNEEHNQHHVTGRPSWNKGVKYGETEAYQKATQTRKANHAEQVKRTVDLWKSGLSAAGVAEVLGICTRQVYTRLRSAEANDYL